jgi:hypothetical protein
VRALTVAALAIAVLTAGRARADDLTPDLRMPVRAGFAYSGIMRAPAASLSLGLDFDAVAIAPRLALTLVGDFDATARPDLPEDDPLSSLGGIGLGAGLFYVTEGRVAFGIESTAWTTFDAKNLVGAGVATRAYLIPYYVPMLKAATGRGDRFGAWVRSAISVWVMGRVDFTSDGNGGTLAFGAALDLARIFVLPYAELITTRFR